MIAFLKLNGNMSGKPIMLPGRHVINLATLALIRGVEDVLDLSLPLADLPQEARAWERGVDELAEQDTEVADYVRTLEEAKDATDLPEASGDAIAREFERYLRRRRDPGDRGGR